MKQLRFFSLLVALAVLLSACAGSGAQTEYTPAEENRLVIYTSHKEEVWRPIVKEFEARTGIWVDVISGGTNEILARVAEEAGNPQADLVFGGGAESLTAYRAYFSPYRCQDADRILSRYQTEDDLWTPFSALSVVLVYNKKFVEPGALTGWADLMKPEFKGRVAFADPTVSGSCFTGLMTMLRALSDGEGDPIRDFALQLDGTVLEGSGAILDAVADGSAWVGITLEETALKRISAGDPIAMVYPVEGTSCVPDGSAIISGAPHEENARLFLDFTVSGDTQSYLQQQLSRRCVRDDLPLPAGLTDLKKIPQVDYDIAWACSQRSTVLTSWAFYFGAEDQP